MILVVDVVDLVGNNHKMDDALNGEHVPISTVGDFHTPLVSVSDYDQYYKRNHIAEDRDDASAEAWLLPSYENVNSRVNAAYLHMRKLGVNGICKSRYGGHRIGFLVHNEDAGSRKIFSYEPPEDDYTIYCIYDKNPAVEILVAAAILDVSVDMIGKIREGHFD